jgi:hypothetical protein
VRRALQAIGFLAALALGGPALSEDGEVLRVRMWRESGPPEKCVDVLFVGDGYQPKHLTRTGKFWRDVERYATRFLKEKPFSDHPKLFNIAGLYLASKEPGCDDGPVDEIDTVLDCRFDAPDGRLLVFHDRAALVGALRHAPDTDVVLVMVNTERFGGAGAVLHEIERHGRHLPSPVFSAQDTRSFQIALHELGHSLADLADEYEDPAAAAHYAWPEGDTDLPYVNVTREMHLDRASFEAIRRTAKWKRFLEMRGAERHEWAHEGGYFRATGVFRPWERCKMRASDDPFCPVCCLEVAKAVHRYAGAPFDEAAWYDANPLRLWK